MDDTGKVSDDMVQYIDNFLLQSELAYDVRPSIAEQVIKEGGKIKIILANR